MVPRMPKLTEDLARAAAQDAANRKMRTAGRKKWDRTDFNLAVEVFKDLWLWPPSSFQNIVDKCTLPLSEEKDSP